MKKAFSAKYKELIYKSFSLFKFSKVVFQTKYLMKENLLKICPKNFFVVTSYLFKNFVLYYVILT